MKRNPSSYWSWGSAFNKHGMGQHVEKTLTQERISMQRAVWFFQEGESGTLNCRHWHVGRGEGSGARIRRSSVRKKRMGKMVKSFFYKY